MAAQDAISLTKARSMLIILLATCDQTLLALDATANVLDTDLRHDLNTMIERTRDGHRIDGITRRRTGRGAQQATCSEHVSCTLPAR